MESLGWTSESITTATGTIEHRWLKDGSEITHEEADQIIITTMGLYTKDKV